MNDTDMLSYAAVEKENAEMRELLKELRPILRKAFFAHYEPQNKADELYDRIVKIVGKE